MDADLISFESLIAAKASAEWAFYSLLVSAGSIVISIITLVIAKKALNTWKDQYREDKKIKLIDTLVSFNNLLISMPKNLENDVGNVNRKLITAAISEIQVRCLVYLNDSPNEKLAENFSALREKFADFIAGNAYKSELGLISGKMLFTDLATPAK
jgi:hypothetical protein